MTHFTVTILLATFNRAHLIGETLDSILAQTYSKWECIIVDDQSEDNTREVVRDYEENDSRFSYYLKTEKYKMGLSGTRNYGLDLARERGAEYIQFFDDDDIMHPEKLERQVDPFLNNSSLGFTVCRYLGFKKVEKIDFDDQSSDIPIMTKNIAEDFLLSKIKINSAGPLFNAKLFEHERFDEELKYAEEWELFNRIFFRYQPHYVPVNESLFYYRSHPNSITAKTETRAEKIGTEILVKEKLFLFLQKRNQIKAPVVAYFLRQFLFQYNNKQNVSAVKNFLDNKKNNISMTDRYKFKAIIFVHEIYLRFMKFVLVKF